MKKCFYELFKKNDFKYIKRYLMFDNYLVLFFKVK